MKLEMPGINVILKEIERVLNEEGFLSLLRQLFLTFNTFFLYQNNLNSPVIAPEISNITIKTLSEPEQLEQLMQQGFTFHSYHMSAQQCKQRLISGAILFCAFVGKELAHGSWAATSSNAYSDFHPFHMKYEHTAYIGGTMTIPKYRRKGINVYVHSKIFQYLKEKGISMAIIAIEKDNVIAQDSQNKLGSIMFGKGYYLRLLFLRFKWLSLKSAPGMPQR